MCSYVQRTTNSVILLSTMHADNAVGDNGKPDIVLYYNATKGGVDVMDQMLGQYTTQRQTNRWPLSLFFNIIDISSFAAYLIYFENNKTIPRKNTQRKSFLQSLAEELCMPIIEERASNRQITRHFSSKSAIECYLGKPVDTTMRSEQSSTSKTHTGRKPVTGSCHICLAQPEKIRRKTRKSCSFCDKPTCDQHTEIISKCLNCI